MNSQEPPNKWTHRLYPNHPNEQKDANKNHLPILATVRWNCSVLPPMVAETLHQPPGS
jgi:hypothetical protein